MGADRVWFVVGDTVVPYDLDSDAVAGEQHNLGELWAGMPAAFATGINAALDWGGTLYVLRDTEYVRIPFATQTVDPDYPKPIAGNWPGLSFDRVDAAMTWGDGKAYLFRGPDYIRYDIAGEHQDPGYPKPIAGHWGGVDAAWVGAGIDAALNPGNGRAYLFRGADYLALDWHTKSVVPGYPKTIADEWHGLPTTVDAAWCNLVDPPPPAASSGDDHGGWVRVYDELRVGGTLAWRNANPGNLLPGRMPYKTALAIDRRGFAIFATEDDGLRALSEVLRSSTYAPLSLSAALALYAPAHHGGNDPVRYAAHVREITGIDPERTVESLTDDEFTAFTGAIRRVEGYTPGTMHHRDEPDLPAELAALLE